MAIPQPPTASIWSNCPNCKSLKSTIKDHVKAFRTLAIFNPDLSANILLQSLDELLGKDEKKAEVVVMTTTVMTTTAPCDSSSSPSVTQLLSSKKDCDDCVDQNFGKNKDEFIKQVPMEERLSTIETKNEDPPTESNLNPPKTDDEGERSLEQEIEKSLADQVSGKKTEKNDETGSSHVQKDSPSTTVLETNKKPPVDEKIPLKTSESTKKKKISKKTSQPNPSPSPAKFEKQKIEEPPTPPPTLESDNLVTDAKMKAADEFIRVSGEGKTISFQCLICYRKLHRRWDCRLHVRCIHFKERRPSQPKQKFFNNTSLTRQSSKSTKMVPKVRKIGNQISNNLEQEESINKKIKKRRTKGSRFTRKRKIIAKNLNNVTVRPKKVILGKKKIDKVTLKMDDTTVAPPPPPLPPPPISSLREPPEGLLVRNPFENFDLKRAFNVQVKLDRLPSSHPKVAPVIVASSSSIIVTKSGANLNTNELLLTSSSSSTNLWTGHKSILRKRKFQEENGDKPFLSTEGTTVTILFGEQQQQKWVHVTPTTKTTSIKNLVEKQKIIRKSTEGKSNSKNSMKKSTSSGKRRFKKKFVVKQFNSLDMSTQDSPSSSSSMTTTTTATTITKNRPQDTSGHLHGNVSGKKLDDKLVIVETPTLYNTPQLLTSLNQTETNNVTPATPSRQKILAKKRVKRLSRNSCWRSHKKGFAPSPVKKALPNQSVLYNENIYDKNDHHNNSNCSKKMEQEPGPKKRHKLNTLQGLFGSKDLLSNEGSKKVSKNTIVATKEVKKSSNQKSKMVGVAPKRKISNGRSKIVSKMAVVLPKRRIKRLSMERSKMSSKTSIFTPRNGVSGLKGPGKKVQNLDPGGQALVPNEAGRASQEEVLSKILRVRVDNLNMQVVARESAQTESESTECAEGMSEAYECTFCSRRWPKQGPIINHIRQVHLKETRTKCPDCGKEFSRQSNLIVHQSLGRCLATKKTSICF